MYVCMWMETEEDKKKTTTKNNKQTNKQKKLNQCQLECQPVVVQSCISSALANYSQSPLYRHPIITDSLLCPWGNRVLIFSL